MRKDSKFWNDKYKKQEIPWDIGLITPPIKTYIDQLTNKDINILIPGAGLAHEASYLHKLGFKNVFICDWAESALEQFSNSNPTFPKSNLICQNFFDLSLQMNLIIEYTFFCAIDPSLRPSYVQKTAELLQDKGELVGLLFAEHFPFDGPPHGGTEKEYRALFSKFFDIQSLEISSKSIKPRLGKELFFKMVKK